MRQYVERQVIGAFLDSALQAGHDISVNDGEEVTLWNSKDKAAIMGALMTTDMDRLYLGARRGPLDEVLGVRGEVVLVYGNDGYDVISDYHTNLEPLMAAADRVSDYWSEAGPWKELEKGIGEAEQKAAHEAGECGEDGICPICDPQAPEGDNEPRRAAGEFDEDDLVRIKANDFEWRVNLEPVEGTDGAPLSLYSKMQIGTAEFHVNAYLFEWFTTSDGKYHRVEPDRDDPSVLVELARNQEMTGLLWHAFAMDGAPETVTIEGIGKGREYAIFVEPFGR
jgi:hypothetical protein